MRRAYKEKMKMPISYKKLWVLLKNKKMKKKDLQELTGISPTTMAKLGKNESVTIDVLVRICTALRCNIGDIIDFILPHNNKVLAEK